MISFGSVCSGIEAASVAWHPLGWQAAWLAEIEPFPAAVLAYRYPFTDNLGDMTTLAERVLLGEIDAPDVLVGGTPCQSFSHAGLREGIADDRGKLIFSFVELANAIDRCRERESVIVWENVPGVLSSKDNAFGCFLGALVGESDALQPAGKKWTNAGCVFGPQRTVAWRVLDAQYFGLAQRRRRVFVVASARDGFDPTEVLFESEGVRRDSAPSRETGKEATGNIGEGANQTGFRQLTFESYAQDETASTMKAHDYKSFTDLVVPTFGIPGNWIGRKPENGGNAVKPMDNLSPFPAATDKHGVAQGSHHGTVRRLTPIECERLQGFPDGFTKIPWRGKDAEGCPDGHRYKALGNSMAVPVVQWIGRRIGQQLGRKA